ncbi:ABC transporter permease subunit [Bosea sp. BK604]|uniref:ABC transporter permease subunit n=1 Tax=Bosea sp. BK604 TaxID=2512180 RepID=UPI00104CE8EB|nr:ABC transporter permease subunit [Bosea sp. BK604]TCR65357.1 general L-amino acid transport system permease protein [Bosea sp. BK604]
MLAHLEATAPKASWMRRVLARGDLVGSLVQIALVAALAGGAWYIVSSTMANLSSRGITTGFAFLSRPAGFDVAFSLLPFTSASPLWMALLVGITNTLFLAVTGMVLGTLLAFAVVSFRLSKSPLASGLAAGYIGLFRNTPILLHLLFWYFAVFAAMPNIRNGLVLEDAIFLNNRGLFVPWPQLSGWGWLIACVLALLPIAASRWMRRQHPTSAFARIDLSLLLGLVLFVAVVVIAATSWEVPVRAGLGMRGGALVIPELMAVIVAMCTYSSAFIAELLRGAIQGIDRGQTEAGQALGLHAGAISRLIVFPQAIRVVIPPLTNQYVNMIKQTAIVAAIAFPDLMLIMGKTVLTQTGQAIESLMIVTSVYLIISLTAAGLMHLYAAKLKAVGQR